jgi:proteasome activator subunit 4
MCLLFEGYGFFSRYFSIESTQEMLDEFRPLLCPFDTALSDGMASLAHFLPTLLPPEQHDLGFK